MAEKVKINESPDSITILGINLKMYILRSAAPCWLIASIMWTKLWICGANSGGTVMFLNCARMVLTMPVLKYTKNNALT